MILIEDRNINIYTMEASRNDIEQLRECMLSSLSHIHIDSNNHAIMGDLLWIHNFGLTILDFAPYSISTDKDTGQFWISRAYLNGIMERRLVCKLAKELCQENNKIVLSETVLRDNCEDDYLNLYNFTEDNVPLINNLYPMAYSPNEHGGKWLLGYSGNVMFPMSRSYIASKSPFPDLDKSLSGKYSLIQIWSQNIDDILFKDIMHAITCTR